MTLLEKYLGSFENYLIEHSFNGEPASLYEPANYIMQLGGKRLRPVMVLMACDAFRDSYEEAMPAAMAIELFHNFTLIHDDIMDAAPLRRGNPTVHKKWGQSTAILCGDMMMIKSIIFLQNLEATISSDLLSMFNKTAIEVCEGQQMDMLFETRNDVGLTEYLTMITLKTSVLLGCSFYLGAIIGGAKREEAKAFYDFGKNLGIAFQLHDDILDAFAEDAIAFGKQVGGDILSNKKTYLLITALQDANPKQKELLEQWLSIKDYDQQEKIAIFKELFVLTGAKQKAEDAQQQFYNRALEALHTVRLSEAKKKTFHELAYGIMQRTR